MTIQNMTVVLTGATGGIGRAIARQLAADGARLILVARNAARLEDLRDELGGDPHRVVAADLDTPAGRQCVVEACSAGPDLLINGAGINEFELLESQCGASIRTMIDINLVSPMLLTQQLLPLLQQRPRSQVINIGSTFGSIGYPGFSAYCASKFGLRGFTESLRRELAGTNTRVSYVAPRATRTGLNSDAVVEMNDALGTAMDDPELVAAAVLRTIRGPSRSDRYIGWPEKLFVRINALFPGLVDNTLRKQLPIIRRFATSKPE
jgi:short-subunit dehydrogenase